jgi:toxin YhaV
LARKQRGRHASKLGAGSGPDQGAALVINGWKLYAHPLFQARLTELARQVARDRDRHPETFRSRAAAQQLRAIRKIIRELPMDPTNSVYLQGNTLGDQRRHWRRVKFLQQFRLFFRFSAADKVIVFAWVNDADSLRVYGSTRDAYRVFRGMLADGNPPDDLPSLLKQCLPLSEPVESA